MTSNRKIISKGRRQTVTDAEIERDLQNSSTQPNLPLREAQKKLRAPPKRLEDQGIEV